jgi:hypothetical protein
MVALVLVPTPARAERDEVGDAASRRAEDALARLRADLARVNAEVAALKRGARTVRNDYRLRERMADAEALAQRLTAAEAALRTHNGPRGLAPTGAPIMAPPQASPQDGSVELEAKADLLADQARKLDAEAGVLAKAATELRSRRVMRRKAGSWERDPFAGLESSRRSVLVSAPTPKSTAGGSTADLGTRGGAIAGPPPPTVAAPVVAPPPKDTTQVASAPVLAAEGPGKAAGGTAASDGASAAKSPPQPQLTSADRQAVEQRLYLDPATAAELRQALGAGGGSLDPDALERGAAALRARARALSAQAQALRVRSRAP